MNTNITIFGWAFFFFCFFGVPFLIYIVFYAHYWSKETKASGERMFGSQKWLIIWTAIIVLAVAWNPVGLRFGSWLSIQFGILYRDAEAVFQNTATSGPPGPQPTLVPILIKNWTISPDGTKASFPTPPIGYQWEYRQHGSVGLINPIMDWVIPAGPTPEIFLRSKADGSCSNPLSLK